MTFTFKQFSRIFPCFQHILNSFINHGVLKTSSKSIHPSWIPTFISFKALLTPVTSSKEMSSNLWGFPQFLSSYQICHPVKFLSSQSVSYPHINLSRSPILVHISEISIVLFIISFVYSFSFVLIYCTLIIHTSLFHYRNYIKEQTVDRSYV